MASTAEITSPSPNNNPLLVFVQNWTADGDRDGERVLAESIDDGMSCLREVIRGRRTLEVEEGDRRAPKQAAQQAPTLAAEVEPPPPAEAPIPVIGHEVEVEEPAAA